MYEFEPERKLEESNQPILYDDSIFENASVFANASYFIFILQYSLNNKEIYFYKKLLNNQTILFQ